MEEQGFLFMDNATNNFVEDHYDFDFEKVFTYFDYEYQDFNAYYFLAETSSDDEPFYAFIDYLTSIGWQPVQSTPDIVIKNDALEDIVNQQSLTCKILEILNKNGEIFKNKRTDFIFSTSYLTYIPLINTLLELRKKNEWLLNFKLLHYIDKKQNVSPNVELMGKFDEIINLKNIGF